VTMKAYVGLIVTVRVRELLTLRLDGVSRDHKGVCWTESKGPRVLNVASRWSIT
jgi:hypothetical protein